MNIAIEFDVVEQVQTGERFYYVNSFRVTREVYVRTLQNEAVVWEQSVKFGKAAIAVRKALIADLENGINGEFPFLMDSKDRNAYKRILAGIKAELASLEVSLSDAQEIHKSLVEGTEE